MDKKQRIVLDDFSGGRNGSVSPLDPRFQPNQVVDAVNVDWHFTSGARKRYGSSSTSMTGSTMTGRVGWLGRHVPGTVDSAAELWATDSAVFNRLAGGTTWAAITAIDAPAVTAAFSITSASLNGLFFISYDSTGATGAARLHVFDGSTVRRTGINPGVTAPTVANTGVGAYAAVLRYYRVRWFNSTGAQIWSEATPSVSFTPSGAGTAARVTRPTAPGEAETAWQLEVSLDNVTFYVLANAVLATTTIDDSNVTTLYAINLAAAKATGTFTLQKSYRLIAADQNRLIGWGSWVSTDKQNRMEFSAVIGALDQGDAERVDTTTNYFMDFDENDSGPPTALVGPIWDRFYAFKSRQMFELIPTGSLDQPFRRVKLSGEIGCVGSHAACRGEDKDGNPALYFLSHRGVYRYGLDGFEFVGKPIQDLIIGPTIGAINMGASVIGHMVFYPDLHQLWVWWSSFGQDFPDRLSVLNVDTGGWANYTGTITNPRCSVMFANTIAASMGFQLVPYVGDSNVANKIFKAADSAATQDSGVSYQAYITTRPIEVPGFRIETGDALVLAPVPATSVTLTATVTPDFGASPVQTGTASLSAAITETRVSRAFGGSALGGAQFIQLTIGDAAIANNNWSFDRIIIPVQRQEPVTG